MTERKYRGKTQDQWRKTFSPNACYGDKLLEEAFDHIRELQAENAKLKIDKERLDWLESHHGWLEQSWIGHKKPSWAARYPFTNYEYQTFYSAREAIDSAMQKESK